MSGAAGRVLDEPVGLFRAGLREGEERARLHAPGIQENGKVSRHSGQEKFLTQGLGKKLLFNGYYTDHIPAFV